MKQDRENVDSMPAHPYSITDPTKCCSWELYNAMNRYFCPICTSGPITAYGLYRHINSIHEDDIVSVRHASRPSFSYHFDLDIPLKDRFKDDENYSEIKHIHETFIDKLTSVEKKLWISTGVVIIEVLDYRLSNSMCKWQSGELDSDPLLRALSNCGLVGMSVKSPQFKNVEKELLKPRPKRCGNCCAQLYQDNADLEMIFPTIKHAAFAVKHVIVLDMNDIHRSYDYLKDLSRVEQSLSRNLEEHWKQSRQNEHLKEAVKRRCLALGLKQIQNINMNPLTYDIGKLVSTFEYRATAADLLEAVYIKLRKDVSTTEPMYLFTLLPSDILTNEQEEKISRLREDNEWIDISTIQQQMQRRKAILALASQFASIWNDILSKDNTSDLRLPSDFCWPIQLKQNEIKCFKRKAHNTSIDVVGLEPFRNMYTYFCNRLLCSIDEEPFEIESDIAKSKLLQYYEEPQFDNDDDKYAGIYETLLK